jgi:hypothetical protein
MRAAHAWLLNAFPRLQATRVAQAYRRTFPAKALSDDARLILEDLALYCGLRQTGFVPGAPDQTAFNEGQRDVLLHLLSLAEVPPESLLTPAFDPETSPHNPPEGDWR